MAVCQIKTIKDKAKNLEKAAQMVRRAAAEGADIIMLPELWNTPATTSFILESKEFASREKHGETYRLLSNLARETKKYIIGGSIPEAIENCPDKVYNTCLCFDRKGNLVTKHQKVHNFDAKRRGDFSFSENDFTQPGPPQISVFNTEYCNIGIGVGYDIRFPEYALLLAN